MEPQTSSKKVELPAGKTDKPAELPVVAAKTGEELDTLLRQRLSRFGTDHVATLHKVIDAAMGDKEIAGSIFLDNTSSKIKKDSDYGKILEGVRKALGVGADAKFSVELQQDRNHVKLVVESTDNKGSILTFALPHSTKEFEPKHLQNIHLFVFPDQLSLLKSSLLPKDQKFGGTIDLEGYRSPKK